MKQLHRWVPSFLSQSSLAPCPGFPSPLFVSFGSVFMELPGPSFNVGLKFQERIRKELCLPVSNPALGRDSFFLVAAFGRCKFQLSCDSVGVLLQATIGGLATDFRVLQLSDRVFRFVVAAKSVGFFITNLLCFECKLFKVFFHLWGNGGPNWRREYSLL